MMMAEGQGNGNDSPERDSAWQPVPDSGGSPSAPDADTDPGAAGAAPPGAPWFPFATPPPAGEPEQPPASASQPPDAQPAPAARQAPGPQPPGTPPASGPQPPGPSAPWQAQPGTQPTWAGPG